LSWANAERPDKVLIIASGALSNPCKDYIRKYAANNNPPYRIKCWEYKQLETFASGHSSLLIDYGLSGELAFVSIMHPRHLEYIGRPHINTLNHFLSIVDELDAEKRDRFFGMVYITSTTLKLRRPVTGEETMGELMHDELDYQTFKETYLLRNADVNVAPHVLVKSTVNHTLEYLFALGDKTRIGVRKASLQLIIDSLREKLQDAGDEAKGLSRNKVLDFYVASPVSCNVYHVICETLPTSEAPYEDKDHDGTQSC